MHDKPVPKLMVRVRSSLDTLSWYAVKSWHVKLAVR
jgi:hypothetical protein